MFHAQNKCELIFDSSAFFNPVQFLLNFQSNERKLKINWTGLKKADDLTQYFITFPFGKKIYTHIIFLTKMKITYYTIYSFCKKNKSKILYQWDGSHLIHQVSTNLCIIKIPTYVIDSKFFLTFSKCLNVSRSLE